MPKEMIHFAVAERTAEHLKSTRYAEALSAEPVGLLLGSVFHDCLFYASPFKPSSLESLAHVQHGHEGQDTFALIRMQATHAERTGHPLPMAMLVGMISHIFADIALHPMVYYFTGNYYAETTRARSIARQRHRAFETIMDMAICPNRIGKARYRLRNILRRSPTVVDTGLPLERLAQTAEVSEAAIARQLTATWTNYARFQSLCLSPLAAQQAHRFRPYLPTPLADLAPLFYSPQFANRTAFFLGPIQYHHPVTGERIQTDIPEQMEAAAEAAAALCRKIEPGLFGTDSLDLPETGPAMDTGLPGTGVEAMRHFATKPFPDLS